MANRKAQPVELTTDTNSPENVRPGMPVVGTFGDGTLPPPTRKIDEASKGKLSAILKRGDLGEKPGSSLMLHDLSGAQAERVLLLSLGKRGCIRRQSVPLGAEERRQDIGRCSRKTRSRDAR